jgi:peptide/nickel transport system substrate-binding protein
MTHFQTNIKNIFFLSACCLIIGFITLSPSRSAATPPSMTVCLPAYIETFDPTDHRSRLTQQVLKNVFESLTDRDDNLSVVPELAESWELIDPLTWEFKLKQGVRFHNGDEFNAADVRFTFERVLSEGGLGDGRTSPRQDLFTPIESVEVVDRYTVRFHTHRPWAVLPKMLSLQEIVPREYLQKIGDRDFARRPIGTGPFRVEGFSQGVRINLYRFNEHRDFVKLAPQEKAERIGRLIFWVEPQTIEQIAGLKQGRFDLIFNVPPSLTASLATSPDISVVGIKATRSHFAEINCVKPPLDNRQIRKALNYAVDMSAIVNGVLLGQGEVLATVLQPMSFGYNTSLKPYPYDPDQARQMLRSAGYPSDRPLRVYSHASNQDMANALILFFTKVGLKASLVTTDSYRPDSTGSEAPWDLFVGSWGNSTLDPVGIIPPKFKSDGRGNYSGYANPGVDLLISNAENTTDMKLRAAYYQRVQEIIHEDAPMVFGFSADEIYALRDNVKDFKPSPTGFFRLKNVRLTPEE